MKHTTYINNTKCQEWGISANQGALFDLLSHLSSWADEIIIDGMVFYWISRDKVIEELPLYYSKADTVYRHLKDLKAKGLIEYVRFGNKDVVSLTGKGKSWVFTNSEINPTNGNTSDTRKSFRNNSDSNPTDNNINNYINTPYIPHESDSDESDFVEPSGSTGDDCLESDTTAINTSYQNGKLQNKHKFPYEAIQSAYNEKTAGRFSSCLTMNTKRKRALRARWNEMVNSIDPTGKTRFSDIDSGLLWFSSFFKKATYNPWNCGDNPSNWTADIDYCLSPSGFTKILEYGLKGELNKQGGEYGQ
jgi:hypothetical protein